MIVITFSTEKTNIVQSASVATLVRLRFLADLTDTEDILCE